MPLQGGFDLSSNVFANEHAFRGMAGEGSKRGKQENNHAVFAKFAHGGNDRGILGQPRGQAKPKKSKCGANEDKTNLLC
tara:strand:- start:718 stop:954 length:237 start_codon:yes stop_codon:yes gene_type:complete